VVSGTDPVAEIGQKNEKKAQGPKITFSKSEEVQKGKNRDQ